jgi:hypothetical protein
MTIDNGDIRRVNAREIDLRGQNDVVNNINCGSRLPRLDQQPAAKLVFSRDPNERLTVGGGAGGVYSDRANPFRKLNTLSRVATSTA